ncbi:MAG: hypothetical protein J5J06_14790 [Phycisphaerae bacterium]|nr:hypothetical protein [Phycisphaerae bacterium]
MISTCGVSRSNGDPPLLRAGGDRLGRNGTTCEPVLGSPPKQNASDTILMSVGCWNSSTPCSRRNAWSRCFTAVEASQVDAVVFGVLEAGVQPWDVTIRIWQDDDGACPPSSTATATLSREQHLTITSGDVGRLVRASLDSPLYLEAGEHVIAEVEAPDGCADVGPGGVFFLGMNRGGETAPSYIRADACSIPDWTALADIGANDVSLVLYLSGPVAEPDCNSNQLPDDCEIEACDGRLSCSDCNGNGIPDGCDFTRSSITKFSTFGAVPEDIAESRGNYAPGFYVPDANANALWRVEPEGSAATPFGGGLASPIGAVFVPDEFGGHGWRLFIANSNDPQAANQADILIVGPDESVSVFADVELTDNGTGMTGLAYLPVSAGGLD